MFSNSIRTVTRAALAIVGGCGLALGFGVSSLGAQTLTPPTIIQTGTAALTVLSTAAPTVSSVAGTPVPQSPTPQSPTPQSPTPQSPTPLAGIETAPVPTIGQPNDGAGSAYLGAVTTATDSGAVVQQIVADSPAAQAGLQVGDVIQSVDGQLVTLQTPLSALLAPHVPGDLALFVIVRRGTSSTLPITLGSRPASPPTATPNFSASFGPPAGGYLGFGLAALNPGFEVVKIDPGSGADKAGVKVGDIITTLNGQTVTSVDQAHAIIQSYRPGTILKIGVLRGAQPLTISAVLGTVPDATQTALSPTAAGTVVATGSVQGTASSNASGTVAAAPSSTPGGVKLGVTYNVLTAGLATARGLSVSEGALITAVIPGSPADVAGIKVGDIVTAVDGKPVDSSHLLAGYMATYHDGDTLILSVSRGGQSLQVSATLAISGAA